MWNSITVQRVIAVLTVTMLAFAGCAQNGLVSENDAVGRNLSAARSKSRSTTERVGSYLQAAENAAPRAGIKDGDAASRETYNAATAELTVLLRSADQSQLWNHPITIASSSGAYHLHFQPGGKKAVWAPNYFTSFVAAREVPSKSIKHRNLQEGIGGALVGVRKMTAREEFSPLAGVTAPVTATLDFQGHDATLTLRDPSKQSKARVAGAERPLAADFSAPLAYYPSVNETIAGLMGALRGGNYTKQTGLYTLQPYDPDRIPVIFVHGLISTARMWRDVINELEFDPEIRARYQCWVFNYPTGNPVLYSALRCREELTKAESRYGLPHGVVLVGHSMGGIVSRAQATTLDRAAWTRGIGSRAERVFAELPEDSLIHRAIIFNANPKVQRIVFICTPHRGSEMAVSGIGQLAARLIALPSNLVAEVKGSMSKVLAAVTGTASLPNSIFSLSPKNPTLLVMEKAPIRAPYHTIFGDRGKHNEPNSTDGIVPYWSSHLDSARSELAVPGPHGACELPETIDELKRILHLQLATTVH